MRQYVREQDGHCAAPEDFERVDDLAVCTPCSFKRICGPDVLKSRADEESGDRGLVANANQALVARIESLEPLPPVRIIDGAAIPQPPKMVMTPNGAIEIRQDLDASDVAHSLLLLLDRAQVAHRSLEALRSDYATTLGEERSLLKTEEAAENAADCADRTAIFLSLLGRPYADKVRPFIITAGRKYAESAREWYAEFFRAVLANEQAHVRASGSTPHRPVAYQRLAECVARIIARQSTPRIVAALANRHATLRFHAERLLTEAERQFFVLGTLYQQ